MFATGPTDDAEDPRTLYDEYKRKCAPLFLRANNVAEMKKLTFEKINDTIDDETLDEILKDVQDCLTGRLVYHQAREEIDANHQHLLDVLGVLWRYGNAVKKSRSCPLTCLFVKKAVKKFGVEHATVIRQVAVLVYSYHDSLCAQYGTNPDTQDDRELTYVADSLVAGFASLRGSDGDERPVTVAKFSTLRS